MVLTFGELCYSLPNFNAWFNPSLLIANFKVWGGNFTVWKATSLIAKFYRLGSYVAYCQFLTFVELRYSLPKFNVWRATLLTGKFNVWGGALLIAKF